MKKMNDEQWKALLARRVTGNSLYYSHLSCDRCWLSRDVRFFEAPESDPFALCQDCLRRLDVEW